MNHYKTIKYKLVKFIIFYTIVFFKNNKVSIINIIKMCNYKISIKFYFFIIK